MVLLYVVIRDFLMYVMPWLVRIISIWVHKSFPTPTEFADEVDDVVEAVASSKTGKAAMEAAEGLLDSAVNAAVGAAGNELQHVEEELLEAAKEGGAGLVRRLISEL
jgi:hypothetical protein